MSNEREAFEAWWAGSNVVGMVTTAEAGWSAALAWAATQQAPAAWQNINKTGEFYEIEQLDTIWHGEFRPLYAHPAPAECAALDISAKGRP